MASKSSKSISSEDFKKLILLLEIRFHENMHRHKNISWETIQARLEKFHADAAGRIKLVSLLEMEQTGGEPDVIAVNLTNKEIQFADCSAESPKGRRSLCYDKEARSSRKEHPPKNSAQEMAIEMGVELLSEEQYRALQQLENFDTKSSSWIQTPIEIRKLGGALFADFRYNTVFVYHNGAESYYAVRGFRGMLTI